MSAFLGIALLLYIHKGKIKHKRLAKFFICAVLVINFVYYLFRIFVRDSVIM